MRRVAISRKVLLAALIVLIALVTVPFPKVLANSYISQETPPYANLGYTPSTSSTGSTCYLYAPGGVPQGGSCAYVVQGSGTMLGEVYGSSYGGHAEWQGAYITDQSPCPSSPGAPCNNGSGASDATANGADCCTMFADVNFYGKMGGSGGEATGAGFGSSNIQLQFYLYEDRQGTYCAQTQCWVVTYWKQIANYVPFGCDQQADNFLLTYPQCVGHAATDVEVAGKGRILYTVAPPDGTSHSYLMTVEVDATGFSSTSTPGCSPDDCPTNAYGYADFFSGPYYFNLLSYGFIKTGPPNAPTPVSPSDGSNILLPSGSSSTPVTLGWAADPDPVPPLSYVIEYSTNANFSPSTRINVPAPSSGGNAPTSYVVGGLTAGKYFWHVLEVAGNNQASAYSQALSFNIIQTVDNAQFMSQTPPPSAMCVGQTAAVTLTFKNTGTSTWTGVGTNPTNPYRLGSQNPQDNNNWGKTRIELPSSIPPGSQYSFSFTITAPQSPGSYNFQWRVLQEGIQWFGDNSLNQQVTVTTCNNAQFVSQVPPPSTMYSGQTATVSITMKNTGSAPWNPDPAANPYRLGSQNPQDNTYWGNTVYISQIGLTTSRIKLSSTVQPGAQYTFTFTVTAPSSPGTYNFQWRMVQELVQWFGDFTPNVQIGVITPGISLTATPTSIPASSIAKSTITAHVADGRSSVVVSFSTTTGTLSATSCTTGSDGSCTITASSRKAGTATIMAGSPGYTNGQTSLTFSGQTLSNDPSSTDWGTQYGNWRILSGYLDGSGTSAEIVSANNFAANRTVTVNAVTVSPGQQPWYTAWIRGKYVDDCNSATLVLGNGPTLSLDLSVASGCVATHYTANTSLSSVTSWHSITMTFVGNEVKIYIDGTLYIDATDPTIGSLGAAKVALASWGPSESQFDGVTIS